MNFERLLYFKIVALFIFGCIGMTASADIITVTNAGLTFTPADITVEVGDTVNWNIAANHNAVEVSEATWNANGTTPNGGFSVDFGGGAVMFNAPGTYWYVCQPHAGQSMKGRVFVNGPPQPMNESFVAHLGGANESPQRWSLGRGLVNLELRGDTLVAAGSFSNLLSAVNTGIAGGAHIHMAPAGSNGDVIFVLQAQLDADMSGGEFRAEDNQFVLSPAQIAALRNQNFYINIHSLLYAAGEIRGQIVPESDAYFGSNLMGIYENPAVSTDAFGAVTAQLNGNQLTISGSYAGLSSPMDTSIVGGIHLHSGFVGSNGPVIVPLNVVPSNDLRSGVIRAEDNTYFLDNTNVLFLNARGFYINIHSLNHQSGELRGQIRGPAHSVYRGHLTGMNENPPVMTSATGMVMVEHMDTIMTLSGSFNGLESPMDTSILGGAHLHAGFAGENGDVVVPLSSAAVEPDLTSIIFPGTSNSFIINSQFDFALALRALYVNVHSINNGSGELRAQILPEAQEYFYARLTGGQETHDIAHTGNGQVIAEFNDGRLTYAGSTVLTSDIDLNVAGGIHVHNAFAGSDGPIGLPLAIEVQDPENEGVVFSIDNIYDVSQGFVDTMRQRGQYVNIHSVDYQAGEVRGQLLGEAQNYFYTPLSGSSENPPVDNNGSGAVALEQTGASLVASGSFNDLESNFDPNVAGGAHLHFGLAGQNGGILYGLNVEQGADGAAGILSADMNTMATSDGFLDTLRQRAVYANFHSVDVASGSVRGNALGFSQMYMTATLDAMNEVQPEMSDASGDVKIELDANRMIVSGSFENLGSPFNPDIAGGAHIHNAGPGENGGVIQGLNVALSADSLRGRFLPGDNSVQNIDAATLAILQDEAAYVNIHTRAIPSGELRGQTLVETNQFPNESSITSPADGASVTIEGDGSIPFVVEFEAVDDVDENEVVYIWQLAADPGFNLVAISANTGTNSMFETTYGVLDGLLQAAGIPVGSTITLYHRVMSSDGSLRTVSTGSSVEITRGIITSTTNLPEGVFTLNVAPNPIVNEAFVEIISPIGGELSIQIIDMQGNRVGLIEDRILERSENMYEINTADYAAGMYILQPIVDGKLLATQKILKL